MISRALPKDSHVKEKDIRDIGVIFKTHLDLGFTDMANAVCQRYMEDFLPRAIQMALKSEGGEDAFVWTTGSWLVDKYLEHARGRERKDLEAALTRGLIRWHALPFTFQTEVLEESLLVAALRISGRLDERFGMKTHAAKMTDVPGHTRGMIPSLADAGVRFLHVGVNPASKVPRVPRLFRWRHPGGKEIVVCCDGTYGGYCPVPGHGKLYALAMTGDNAGPPGWDTVRGVYRNLREQFPQAAVHATSLEELAAAVWNIRDVLPVVTSEIGDTWIHGYGSDPWKMGAFRTLVAARKRWIESGKLDPESREGRAFDNHLLLTAEHTWGLDEKTWMSNGSPLSKIRHSYRKDEFARSRSLPAFQKMESSWLEQRNYIRQAVESLSQRTLRREAGELLAPLTPTKVAATKPLRGGVPSQVALKLGKKSWVLGDDGAWKFGGRPGGWLGRLSYEVYGGADYERYLKTYVNKEERYGVWAPYDFNKPGCGDVLEHRQTWHPRVKGYRQEGNDGFFVELEFPKLAVKDFGAPALVQIGVFPTASGSLVLDVNWFDKPACRMGEALWLSFRFPVPQGSDWQLHKLGGAVDPKDVVRFGNRHLHIVNDGVEVQTPTGERWGVSSREAALVAPGQFPLVAFSNRQPDPTSEGIAFNLFNNTWGTNFPMWYDDDARFRFEIVHQCV